jgi:hypothetical protein
MNPDSLTILCPRKPYPPQWLSWPGFLKLNSIWYAPDSGLKYFLGKIYDIFKVRGLVTRTETLGIFPGQ